jgi:hypothetical protein
MGQPAVEETPDQILGGAGGRDGVSGGQAANEHPTGRRQPEQPDRRPSDERAVIDPADTGVERQPEPERKTPGVRA